MIVDDTDIGLPGMGFGIAQVFCYPDVQPLFQCHFLWLLVGSSVYFRGDLPQLLSYLLLGLS